MTAQDLEFLGAFWFEKDCPSRIEKERFRVYRVPYRSSMGPVRLNEEQVNEQWLGVKDLADLYRDKRESISAPLLKTCKHIFGFKTERKE